MLSIDINHPDVLNFIKIKRDLTKVTGANISVKLNNEFMKAVENDEDYILKFPCDSEILEGFEPDEYNKLIQIPNENIYLKRIKAKEYWEELIKSAHGYAEPGLMFWDRMTNYSPDGVYKEYQQKTTNPCSEIAMQPNDACRLMVVNLYSFVKDPFTDKATFNYAKFYRINYEAMRLADDLVDLEIEHINKILLKISQDPEPDEIKINEYMLWMKIKNEASKTRRTGLGFTGLADTLAALGVKYDSEQALEIIMDIMDTKMESELDCTIDLGKLRGTFTDWNPNNEFSVSGDDQTGYVITGGRNSFYDFIYNEFEEQTIEMYNYGRRNLSWSTVAPTGSVSILTQTTSGIEPLFLPYYTRRVKCEEGEPGDFTDENGVEFKEFTVFHPKFNDWIMYKLHNLKDIDFIKILNKHTKSSETVLDKIHLHISNSEEFYKDLFELSPYYQATANDINWKKRIEIQALIQKYISHSISSTINLPSTVTKKEVSEIYYESWKQGLKGITVYRDGSRSGILISGSQTENTTKFEYNHAPKRPKVLKANYHFKTLNGIHYGVIVGLYHDKPYEIFVIENPLLHDDIKGEVIKIESGIYNFISPRYTIENLQESSVRNEEANHTRSMSLLLRHGIDPKHVIDQTEKVKLEFGSFAKVIIRTLKTYIKDKTVSSLKCDNCGDNLVYEGGCMMCKSCGESKCS